MVCKHGDFIDIGLGQKQCIWCDKIFQEQEFQDAELIGLEEGEEE